MKTEWIKGYKALNEDMTCQNFKFEVGKEYTESEVKLCEKGFHFCLNPLDVLKFYDLTKCKLAVIVAKNVSKEKEKNDTKRVAHTIKIESVLNLADYIKLSFDYVWKSCSKTKSKKLASSGDSAQLASSGDSAKLASSGYSAQLASSGYSAKLASSGYSAKLASSGEDSVIAGIGINNQAKGIIGNWLVLAEWKDNKPICVKAVLIDGTIIKENTDYKLINGEFKEI